MAYNRNGYSGGRSRPRPERFDREFGNDDGPDFGPPSRQKRVGKARRRPGVSQRRGKSSHFKAGQQAERRKLAEYLSRPYDDGYERQDEYSDREVNSDRVKIGYRL